MTGESDVAVTRDVVDRLLAAIEHRDLRSIADVLAPTTTWQNVPHEVFTGREAVVRLLGSILTWSDRVEWEVVSASYDAGIAWLERVDRFWIDGEQHAVRCNGVVAVDTASGHVTSVRDYVDLGEWRARIDPALERMAARPGIDVVDRHVRAVEALDRVAMAADYSFDATLDRAGIVHRGWRGIADYFGTVPQRLHGGAVRFGLPGPVPGAAHDTDLIAVRWHIVDDDTVHASGHDTFRVEGGRIVDQTVELDSSDF